MSRNQDEGGNGKKRSLFDMDNGFATTLAAMISMLASPALNEFTAPYVIWLAQRSYPPDLVELIRVVWMFCCWPLTFFAAHAGTVAAMSILTLYVVQRSVAF